ncbi:class II SORL domain-containing protein [Methanolobus chelungpuianus]|uniref:Desulfoferrodoxin n=1 Tax=Methanolobus chelungpuianus TaxID=502115 RepID=A0AAE3KXB4_9EURY|nr:class II SORL domain-containing protein [Methanolobus chelungpuianus]MCQ6962856.1 desulfoferrodoxin [Methanolobus chelungpuianus]
MNFADILKGREAEGKEKHVPEIDIIRGHGKDKNDFVRVTVGKEVPHPNTAEHHIEWVELYGITKEGRTINFGRMGFEPIYTDPVATFHVKGIDNFKAFCALEYCNIHGVWQNCIEV